MQRAHDRIAELSVRGLDLPTLWQESSEAVRRVIREELAAPRTKPRQARPKAVGVEPVRATRMP